MAQRKASGEPAGAGELAVTAHAGLHGVCHACPDPVAVVSLPQGTVLEVNRKFREILGVPDPIPADLSIASLGGPDLGRLGRGRDGAGSRVFRKISLGGIEGRGRLVPIPEAFPAQGFLEFVPGPPGLPVREHRLKELLEERLQQIRNLERLRSLGETAAVIVHELRTPLSSLRLGVEKVRDAPELEASLRERLEAALEQLGRADRLLESIRNFAHPRALELRPLDVRKMFEEATAAVEASREGPRTEVVLDVRPDPLRLVGDADRLGEAIQNLIANAVDAMPAGGTIELRARLHARRPGWIELRVADHGSGIPAALLHRVFQPFFTTKRAGTGLGLAIVRKAVELHGGFMSLRSVPDQGTTVILELPAGG